MSDAALQCPNSGCHLCVKDGKVFCNDHQIPLTIDNESPIEPDSEPLAMQHVLYVAFESPRGPGFVLIDEEQ